MNLKGKKAASKIFLSFVKNTITFKTSENFFLFFILIIAAFIYLIIFNNLLPGMLPANFPTYVDLDYGFGDGPGYLNFNFSNLKIILSQHRTFGLPIILKFYRLFDFNLIYWAKFNYLLFSFSIYFLLYSLLKSNFSKPFSFFFSLGILLSYNLYLFLYYWTEIISIIFLNISISFFILAIHYNRSLYFFLFSFFLFYTYQIRPSFVTFTIIPVIFVLIKYLWSKNLGILKKTFYYSLSPLILFIVIRFFITGYIGFVPFSGVQMSGHAMYYLDKEIIKEISPKNKTFAANLLVRKKKLSPPCNLTVEEAKRNKIDALKHRYECWNYYIMSSWLEKIKIKKDIEPFTKKSKNLEAWKYVRTLELFFLLAGNNNEIDKELVQFSLEIYKIKFYDQVKWLINSSFEGIKIHLPRLKFLIILYVITAIFYYFLKEKKKRNNKDNDKLKSRNEFSLIISLAIYQIINFVIFAMIHVPDQRTMAIQYYLTLPSILSFLISYIIYKKKYN
jgi:hypothetical protein